MARPKGRQLGLDAGTERSHRSTRGRAIALAIMSNLKTRAGVQPAV